jgi:hypothetical protein
MFSHLAFIGEAFAECDSPSGIERASRRANDAAQAFAASKFL